MGALSIAGLYNKFLDKLVRNLANSVLVFIQFNKATALRRFKANLNGSRACGNVAEFESKEVARAPIVDKLPAAEILEGAGNLVSSDFNVILEITTGSPPKIGVAALSGYGDTR